MSSSTRAYQGSAQSFTPTSTRSSTSTSNNQHFSSRIDAYLADPTKAQPSCRMHHVVEDKGGLSAARRTQAQLDELEAMMARQSTILEEHTSHLSRITSSRLVHTRDQLDVVPVRPPQLEVVVSTQLREYHDFFLASQHPGASPALRRLASKYRLEIEDDGIRDRELWTGVARHWYSNASGKTPTAVGL
ncbi:uncharacterized protein PAC_07933 [Phialocephala subalpina]|uniref:Uncharacterized protein n=1 Tax=Phialocephala subalpina TaxID=576137 RepID=A0A1L7WZ47_9HELO|nr:uncharacterized protein PAC_07933 [Phialocephala subalpina]